MSFLIPDINTFFLLHTHFFSLLVYHVPILSCNPTVYTLCTVSTWGSVYSKPDKCNAKTRCKNQSNGKTNRQVHHICNEERAHDSKTTKDSIGCHFDSHKDEEVTEPSHITLGYLISQGSSIFTKE